MAIKNEVYEANLNSKSISYFFGVYSAWFLIKKLFEKKLH